MVATGPGIIATGPGNEPARWCQKHYYLGNQYLGSRRFYAVRTNNNAYSYQCHEALCCPTCGEIWGRVLFVPHPEWNPGAKYSWHFNSTSCHKHGGGTFLTSLHPEQLKEITDIPLLRHEFLTLTSNPLTL